MTGFARQILPSTTALRVFEAAARRLTFTGAAEELSLTQSAVSKQIKALEEVLGVTLFVRLNSGLVLTDMGRAYLEDVQQILVLLRTASSKLTQRSKSPRTLILNVPATLGDRWLLPRFADFVRIHPEIQVQFTGFLSRDRREQMAPDGEFRGSDGPPPGFVCDYLFGRRLLLLASPQLLVQRGIRGPDDLAEAPRLVHFQAPQAWNEFAAAAGLTLSSNAPTTRYEFYSTLISGAAAGLGLALVPSVLVEDELARGTLVNALALDFTYRVGYYFMLPEHKQHDPALAELRGWVNAQAMQTRLAHKETQAVNEETPQPASDRVIHPNNIADE